MKKALKILFIIAVIAHYILLQFFGISIFTTTLLFYTLLYLGAYNLIVYYAKPGNLKVLLFNLRMIFVIILIYEFSATFVFNFLNSFMEKKVGVYTSLYRHKEQMMLLNKFKKSYYRDTWEDGYAPYYRHFHQTIDFTYPAQYNSAGLRGPEPIKDTDSITTIAVLGDSFTEGYGAPVDSTVPFRLEVYLQEKKKNVNVINAGICGSNPYSAIKLYHNVVSKYDPDIILFEVNTEDAEENYISRNSHSMPLREQFYAVSHIYRFIDRFFRHASPDMEKRINYAVILAGQFLELKKEIGEKPKLLLVPVPMQNQIHSPPEVLDSVILNSGLPFVDSRSNYRKHIPNNADTLNLYYWKNDRHHTPKGYDLLAKIVAQELIERNYVRAD